MTKDTTRGEYLPQELSAVPKTDPKQNSCFIITSYQNNHYAQRSHLTPHKDHDIWSQMTSRHFLNLIILRKRSGMNADERFHTSKTVANANKNPNQIMYALPNTCGAFAPFSNTTGHEMLRQSSVPGLKHAFHLSLQLLLVTFCHVPINMSCVNPWDAVWKKCFFTASVTFVRL
jgi:hypothetical protein